MRALIFGASGQDGFYLSKLLINQTIDIIGVSRSFGDWLQGDVADFPFVASVIQDVQPQMIFHLAADSTTSHNALFSNHAAISTGTINILEAARKFSPQAKIFLSGSAAQFVNTGTPIHEQTLFHASSSYAVARIHSVYAGRYFRERFSLPVYVGYFFNHDSPLRSERHVNQKIAAAARRIARGNVEKLMLGSPAVAKEFNFAGDIVEAVWTLVNQDTVFEAVLGSGEAHTIAEWAECCFALNGLDWREHVEIEQGYRPEYDRLVSDPALIRSLGWRPQVGFTELAAMMCAHPPLDRD